METRQRILAAAVQLFGERGYRGTTTRRIASEARVSEVTIFRHFGSKRTLIEEALDTQLDQSLRSALPRDPVDVASELGGWANKQLKRLRQRQSVIRTLLGEAETDPDLAQGMLDAFRDMYEELDGYLRRARRRGLVEASVDVDTVAVTLVGALISDATRRDLLPEVYRVAPRKAADRYVAILAPALAGRKDDAP